MNIFNRIDISFNPHTNTYYLWVFNNEKGFQIQITKEIYDNLSIIY